MLLGANKTDSPYLLPDQEAYYNALARLGGNYTRYVVKQRLDPGLEQIFPHRRLSDGRYDLRLWNEEYWRRFEDGLRMTMDRGIVVQLELWDRFDFGSARTYPASPWRPSNNVTYSAEETGLPEEWEGEDAAVHRHPFFGAVTADEGESPLLGFQKALVGKVLSITLRYHHVLYVITNESTLPLGWSEYWARYIRKVASDQNVTIEVSEMPWTLADRFPFPWQEPALGTPEKWIGHVIGHPELYSFCAFQFQPILNSGQDHYDRITRIVQRVHDAPPGPRPINAVKVFARQQIIGASPEPNAQTRFWRLLMAGWAAVSLHREHPGTGYLGFSEAGQRNLSAARKFCDAIVPWECTPKPGLLLNRESDEAYLLANPGKAIGVYFPSTGSVELDVQEFAGATFNLSWISIESGEYGREPVTVGPAKVIPLSTPESGSNAGWAAALVVQPH